MRKLLMFLVLWTVCGCTANSDDKIIVGVSKCEGESGTKRTVRMDENGKIKIEDVPYNEPAAYFLATRSGHVIPCTKEQYDEAYHALWSKKTPQ